MCGIFGILNYKKLNKSLFNSSLELLNHRGPDNNSVVTSSKLCFGFVRLAIMELSPLGDQPMKSSRTGNIISLNGEIYNYKYLSELVKSKGINIESNSDVEVVLAVFDLYGISKTLELIEGMFAFSIFDKKENKVFFARDHFGQKPLFYSPTSKGFIFSSEIKSIINYIGDAKLDRINSYNSLFTNGLPPRSKTCFKNIFSLDPGELITYSLDNGKYENRSYFDIESLVDESTYNSLKNASSKDVINQYNDLLHESVKLHINSDAPLASLFSLGLDSTLISVIAAKYTDIDLYNFQSEMDDTSIYLKKFKRDFDFNIHQVNEKIMDYDGNFAKMMFHYEMPNKSEGTALSLLCERAKKDGNKVLLTGDSADEIFGGYGHHLDFYGKTRAYNSFINKKIIRGFRHFFPGSIFNTPKYNPLGTDYNTSPPFKNLDEIPLNMIYHSGNRLCEWQNKLNSYSFISDPVERATNAYLLDEVGYRLERFLVRGDRFSMMNSVELRNPFLYKPLVKFAANLPIKYKIKKNIKGTYEQKHILREVAKINNVPRSIIKRRKIATPIKTQASHDKILKNINLSGVSDLLSISQDKIKYALFNSYDIDSDRSKYSFIAMEVLHKLFVEKVHYQELTEQFKGYVDYEK
jgi:asparagine synthase (glutamine-hydrolysing)